MTLAEEIEILIRARYPILYIISSEEARVREMMAIIASRRQKKLLEWSCTTGLIPAGVSIQGQKYRTSPTKDPLLALDQVIDQVEPAIFLFKDFHPFLTRNHPVVIRRLKEIAQDLKNSVKTIVLVSPVAEIPVELEKEITLLSLPLPEAEQMRGLISQIIEEVRQIGTVRVNLDAGESERLAQAALGLTLAEAENVFAKAIVQDQLLSVAAVTQVLDEKRQIIRKSGLLEYYASDADFGQIGGLECLKQWLQSRRAAFQEEARRFGLPAPRGILLLGVQGCGKSLCAKAVANGWQLPLLRFDMGRMFSSYVGSSEENMRRAIAVAESIAPAVLWIDEIDKAFAGAHGSGAGDSGTAARVFGTFLTWLSEKSAPVFVVATANEIVHLPPELLRKGRFDEIFFVDLPSLRERAEVFAIHLARRGRKPDAFDLAALAAATNNFSGAEIEQVIISGLYDAFAEQVELSTQHLLRGALQTVPLMVTMEEEIARLRAWARGRARPASVLTKESSEVV